MQHDHDGDGHDFPPGTRRLLDPHSGVVIGQDAVVLVPAPSLDVNDPLNWTKWRKNMAMAMIHLYLTASFLAVGALYAIFEPLTEQTGLSFAQLNEGTGFTYLLFGIGPFFFMPLAKVIGKRPVYLISLIGQGAMMIWAAYTVGNSQWVANRILLGFFASPSFTLCTVSVADLWFLHERAFHMTMYTLAIYLIPLIAPIIGSGLFDALGYKAVLLMAGGFCFICAIVCFAFMEETSYNRPPPVAPASSRTEPTSLDDKQDDSKEMLGAAPTRETALTDDRALQGQPKSLISRMGFMHVEKPIVWARVLITGVVHPLLAGLAVPVVWYAAFQFGIYQVWYNIGNAIQSLVLAAPPYNFSATAVGLSFFGPIIVTIPVSYWGGIWSDKITIYMARRNGGISEPEHKLWLTLPLFLAGPAGLLLMGMGAYYELHWIMYVIGSSILFGLGPLGTVLSINYCFDSFHGVHDVGDSSSEAAPYWLGTVLLSMCLAFGFNYAITPWVLNLGYKIWSITATVVFIVSAATAIGMIYVGKPLRRSGAGLYMRILRL